MLNTRNNDIADKYFDLVQQEIKNLISQDKEIKPDEVQKFNNEIFNQPDDIKLEIRGYIDKATINNLDIKRIAKVIYDKFKLQVKNNVFNQTDSQDVPNPLIGEKKHIKTFEQFNDNKFKIFETLLQFPFSRNGKFGGEGTHVMILPNSGYLKKYWDKIGYVTVNSDGSYDLHDALGGSKKERLEKPWNYSSVYFTNAIPGVHFNWIKNSIIYDDQKTPVGKIDEVEIDSNKYNI